MSNKPASIHDACQTDIEEGEFIPDVGNIHVGSRLGPGNTAENYAVAAPSEDGSSFQCSGRGICDHSNKSEACHESREGNVQMGNLAYSKRIDELIDVKGGIPCCSLAVLLRLHQVFWHFILSHGPNFGWQFNIHVLK